MTEPFLPPTPNEPAPITEYLQRFNRKERYWLLRNALSGQEEHSKLSDHFRERLGTVLGIRIPSAAWWAMDYHIDWLFAALVLSRNGGNEKKRHVNPYLPVKADKPSRLIRGSQEDFDFIVAFDRTIILIEAKGVTSWNSEQLVSKCQRLQDWKDYVHAAGDDGVSNNGPLAIYLVMMSPIEPKEAEPPPWPDFVRLNGRVPFFIPMDLSAAPPVFLAPERCNTNGKASSSGDHWQLKATKRVVLDE